MDDWEMKESFVWTDPERMSGIPCFRGTRVPIKTLFDYLAAGDSLEEFLDDFPGVKREQAFAAIEAAGTKLVHAAELEPVA